MGVCGGPLATPLSPTPPQVGYVSRLRRLLLLADASRAGPPFWPLLFPGCIFLTAWVHWCAGWLLVMCTLLCCLQCFTAPTCAPNQISGKARLFLHTSSSRRVVIINEIHCQWRNTAPCLCCRSSSAQADDPRCPQHHTGRRADGHRPTQSMLPAYHQTPSPQLHPSSSSQQDQSLHQLVQSQAAQSPAGSPCCLGGSPQRPHTHHEDVSKPGKHQQPASPKLTKRQSGNPFASEHSTEKGSAGLRQQGSSSLSRGVSGNPFAAMREIKSESSRIASSQEQADSEHLAGGPPVVDSKVHGMLCLGSDMESNTAAAAAGRVQEHAQPSSQQEIPRCGGSSAHAASSASVLKNPEMSPLQNGLIRCAASPYSCISAIDAAVESMFVSSCIHVFDGFFG